MSGKHGHKPFEGHMHDYEAHIKAVEEDLEYYRAKRFEPRIFYLLRRNVVTFSDLLNARAALKRKNQFFKPRKPEGNNSEARVRYVDLPCGCVVRDVPGELAQHVVAGEVAVLVVDLLEVIDVEHEQRQRPAVACAAAPSRARGTRGSSACCGTA